MRGGNIRECRLLIRVRGEFIREGKSFRAADVAESGLIGLLEVREESGVNDDVGMLGEVGVRLVFLAEVGFTEPDKHAGVAVEGLFDLGTAQGVFQASAAGARSIGIWRRGSQESEARRCIFRVRLRRGGEAGEDAIRDLGLGLELSVAFELAFSGEFGAVGREMASARIEEG